MTPKGHAIPSKTQLLSYGTPALPGDVYLPAIYFGALLLRPWLSF